MNDEFLDYINKKLRFAIANKKLLVTAPQITDVISLKERLRLSFKYGVAYKNYPYAHDPLAHGSWSRGPGQHGGKRLESGELPGVPRLSMRKVVSATTEGNAGGGKKLTAVQKSRAKLQKAQAAYQQATTDAQRASILGDKYRINPTGTLERIPRSETSAGKQNTQEFKKELLSDLNTYILDIKMPAGELAGTLIRLQKIKQEEGRDDKKGKHWVIVDKGNGIIEIGQKNQKTGKIKKGTSQEVDLKEYANAVKAAADVRSWAGAGTPKAPLQITGTTGTGSNPKIIEGTVVSSESIPKTPPAKPLTRAEKRAAAKIAKDEAAAAATKTAVQNATTPPAGTTPPVKPLTRAEKRAAAKIAKDEAAAAATKTPTAPAGTTPPAPTPAADGTKKPKAPPAAGGTKKPKAAPVDDPDKPKYSFQFGKLTKATKDQIAADVKAAAEGANPNRKYRSLMELKKPGENATEAEKAKYYKQQDALRREIAKATKEYNAQKEKENPGEERPPVNRATPEQTREWIKKGTEETEAKIKKDQFQERISAQIRAQQLKDETPEQRQFRIKEGININKIGTNQISPANQARYDRIGADSGGKTTASLALRLQDAAAAINNRPQSLIQKLQGAIKSVFEVNPYRDAGAMGNPTRQQAQRNLAQIQARNIVSKRTDEEIMRGQPPLYTNAKPGSVADIVNKIRLQLSRVNELNLVYIQQLASIQANAPIPSGPRSSGGIPGRPVPRPGIRPGAPTPPPSRGPALPSPNPGNTSRGPALPSPRPGNTSRGPALPSPNPGNTSRGPALPSPKPPDFRKGAASLGQSLVDSGKTVAQRIRDFIKGRKS